MMPPVEAPNTAIEAFDEAVWRQAKADKERRAQEEAARAEREPEPSEQPGEVRLFFDEPVRAEFDPVKVTDGKGERVDGEDARTLPGDPDVVVASLDVLPEGSYTVEWRITSADGDPISGEYGFAVDASAAVAGGEGGGSRAEEDPGGPGLGLVLGVLLVGGLVAAGFVMLRRG